MLHGRPGMDTETTRQVIAAAVENYMRAGGRRCERKRRQDQSSQKEQRRRLALTSIRRRMSRIVACSAGVLVLRALRRMSRFSSPQRSCSMISSRSWPASTNSRRLRQTKRIALQFKPKTLALHVFDPAGPQKSPPMVLDPFPWLSRPDQTPPFGFDTTVPCTPRSRIPQRGFAVRRTRPL